MTIYRGYESGGRLATELSPPPASMKPALVKPDLDEVAMHTYALYAAFKAQGFTANEALELVNTWFGKMLDGAT